MPERVAVLHQLERQVGVLMRRARRVIGDRAAMVHPDLPPPAYLVLSFLHSNGPSRASEVAEVFSLDKGAVSRNVHVLVELDLVTKSADPEDGRAMLLSTTPTAEERMQQISTQRLAGLDEKLGSWSSEDLVRFVEQFARYNDLLE